MTGDTESIAALAEQCIALMRDGAHLDDVFVRVAVPAGAWRGVLDAMAHILAGAAEGSVEETMLDQVGAAINGMGEGV